jgi:hypothetical protein
MLTTVSLLETRVRNGVVMVRYAVGEVSSTKPPR